MTRQLWTPRLVVALSLTLLADLTGGAATAQTTDPNDWRRGTTLAGFVGGASRTPGTGAAAGATLGWEVTPLFTVEGRGIWMAGGPGTSAFTALLGSRVHLAPGRALAPYASAAVGVYRARVESGRPLPRLYSRRMGGGGMPFEEHRTFDDFVLGLGGGADLYLARHLSLRPDVTVLLVKAPRDIRAVPLYGFSIAYHFEDHPVTPLKFVGP